VSVLLFSFYPPSVKVDNKSGQQVKDINFQEGKIKKAPVKTAASSSNGGAEGELQFQNLKPLCARPLPILMLPVGGKISTLSLTLVSTEKSAIINQGIFPHYLFFRHVGHHVLLFFIEEGVASHS